MSTENKTNPPNYFDAKEFRKLGHEIVDLLADQIHQPNSRVLDYKNPDELFSDWRASVGKVVGSTDSSLIPMLEKVLGQSIRLHHPRYMGHQISPVAPVSALSGLMVDLLNNGMGVYEMGMAGTALERLVIEFTGQQFGFDERCGGVLTSGGSLGNLTALLTARNVKSEEAVSRGETDRTLQPALMVSENAHYCVKRATQVMGWGEEGVIKVPVNDRFQMDVGQLNALFARAKESGKNVIAVVGSACSTATGSYDNLNAIGEFCRQRNLWFHVDGAHGAAAAFSPKYRSLLSGIELADSVVLDYHKLLLTPALTTALVFRNADHNYRTFTQKADYLFAKGEVDRNWQDVALRSFECTKLMMSLKVFSIYHAFGLTAWESNVTYLYDLARAFAEMIRSRERLQLLVYPESNIVCYRFLADRDNEPLNNQINLAIRDQILRDGDFYIVQTIVDGRQWLRSTLGSATTKHSDLLAVLDAIDSIGDRMVRDVGKEL
jgi:L-2,4-diaminobutyrate decarboxylase